MKVLKCIARDKTIPGSNWGITSMRLGCAIVAAVSLAISVPVMAATQIVDGAGKLTGATGVTVDDIFYDVTFLDENCVSVFDGCNSVSDFTFSTRESAMRAGQALLDQVFLDTPSGAFDTNPSLTRGCSLQNCAATIPFAVDRQSPPNVAFAVAGNTPTVDSVGFTAFPIYMTDWNHPSLDTYFWAKFTPRAPESGVPEPATWAMMLLGFGSIGGAMRSAKRRQKLTASCA